MPPKTAEPHCPTTRARGWLNATAGIIRQDFLATSPREDGRCRRQDLIGGDWSVNLGKHGTDVRAGYRTGV